MTKIIAHRGASAVAPENTMSAFELAYRAGAEGIETDVHLTRDNIPVLMHDERVNRTTNGTGYIKDYSFAQLQQLDAGSWFASRFKDSRVLSLMEFLEWVKDKPLNLNIELKNNKIDYENLEQIVYEQVSHYRLLNRTILSTFNPRSVQRLKHANQDIGVALLTSRRNRNLVQHARTLGANAVHIKYRLLNNLLVNQCHQEKMSVRVYTINRTRQMGTCFSLDCDGIFTDVPHLALDYRDKFNQSH
ncbi:glycerophosphodiester phosphodiesterase [Virgibacillus kekensis]|uniref:Glycerophosphodiester phosphodiesterase n=1 Tax=Virgibacillus kekensis TaxID=202261 RepID=A0ABV9DJH8_9BACI